MPAAEPPPPFVPETAAAGRAAKMTPDLRAVVARPGREGDAAPRGGRSSPCPSTTASTNSARGSRADSGRTRSATRRAAPLKGPDGRPALTEGAALDGAIGNLASIRFDRPADVERFATEPGVPAVRLPATRDRDDHPAPGGRRQADRRRRCS